MVSVLLVLLLIGSAVSAPPSPSIGVAFSGGGLTAFLETTCALEALRQSTAGARWSSDDWQAAVNSGGTLGYVLWESVAARSGGLVFPPFAKFPNATFKQLSAKYEKYEGGAASRKWFAEVLDVVPSLAASLSLPHAAKTNGSGWWLTALETALLTYGLKADAIVSGTRPAVAGVALVRSSSTPIKRAGTSGVMKYAVDNGRNNLFPSEYDFATRVVSARGNSSLEWSDATTYSVLAGASMSSAFWGTSIIEITSSLEFDLSKGFLIDLPHEVYAVDGGVADTTMIAAMLRRKVAHVVVFLNMNNDLTTSRFVSVATRRRGCSLPLSRVACHSPPPSLSLSLSLRSNATLAYLFGIETPTDAQNTLEGRALAQVFPSSLYAATIANLTEGNSIFSAKLVNVPVLANEYLGVEAYTLGSLLLIGNQRNEEFLNSFADPAVKANTPAAWPNNIPVGMSTFEANLMCLWSAYRVQTLDSELTALWA